MWARRRRRLTSRWALTSRSTTSGVLMGLVSPLFSWTGVVGRSWFRCSHRHFTSGRRSSDQIASAFGDDCYGIDRIRGGRPEGRYLPRRLAGDRLLLIVCGEVNGVQSRKIDTAQIEVSDRASAQDRQPANARIFTRNGIVHPTRSKPESDVRKEAERHIRQGALDGRVVQTAATNATRNAAHVSTRCGLRSRGGQASTRPHWRGSIDAARLIARAPDGANLRWRFLRIRVRRDLGPRARRRFFRPCSQPPLLRLLNERQQSGSHRNWTAT